MSRRDFTLADAGREFVRHPSPWMIGVTLAAAATARTIAGDWQVTDAVVPLVMVGVFPLAEWVIHVAILHWRPRRLGPVVVDTRLARDHRRHHAEPRDVPLIFIPWPTLLWLLPVATAVALVAFPRPGLGLTFLTLLTALGLGYEWCHYLIHSDYKPRSDVYRAIWRNHRRHHFKNEHYWFTVTSAGTADRVLGTCPDPATVPTSPTARQLHVTPAR
ncbi:sterol desaturase family protein [Mycolicibacterium smegmatis]|jgi:hypothetical protein|uniref:sterol desaturase family protein n=1 Tax=Mycolicibacterium smegmatis TaxID=1772 RepID=UPI0013035937|nr:sterol desaturase family protein [Mycolicibacterium smegmatis]ULN38333.1 sterol desaturase family protein [Mycolicibacterium smegmatis]